MASTLLVPHPRAAAWIAALLFAVMGCAGPVADANDGVRLVARRADVPPDPGGPLIGVARLELGGDRRIGGFSSVLRLGDPERLLLASDRNWLVETVPVFDDDGALDGLEDARIRRFPMPEGWSDDVEAMALVDGRLMIATEGTQHLPDRLIWLDGPPHAPTGVADDRTITGLGLRPNRGFEALATLPDGGWLAVAETEIDGTFPAIAADGSAYRYLAAPEHAPTGADRLGDRLFFVERKLSLLGGWQARIACLEVAALETDAVLAPRTLALLGVGDRIDNMEGIAVWERGDDVEILLVSDDNYHPAQRSLVLHYRLPGGASGGCGPSTHEQAERD